MKNKLIIALAIIIPIVAIIVYLKVTTPKLEPEPTPPPEEKIPTIDELENDPSVLLDYYLENVKQEIFYAQETTYTGDYKIVFEAQPCLIHIDKEKNALYYIHDLRYTEALKDQKIEELTFEKIKELMDVEKIKYNIVSVSKVAGELAGEVEGTAIQIEYDQKLEYYNNDNQKLYYFGPYSDYLRTWGTSYRKYFKKDDVTEKTRKGYSYKPEIGMKKSEVILSDWKKPDEIVKRPGSNYETWKYYGDREVSFENGIVYYIQER